jgi:hypothetical protein
MIIFNAMVFFFFSFCGWVRTQVVCYSQLVLGSDILYDSEKASSERITLHTG